MPRTLHYSPKLSRFLVSVLYHEAKHRRIPMTRLTDELLSKQLIGSPAWEKAKAARIAEDPPSQ